MDVQLGELGRIVLILRQQFGDHVVLVVGRVDQAGLTSAVRRVQRVGNLVGRHAKRVRLVAIDVDGELRVLAPAGRW